jgi:hypothetical protein
MPDLTLFRTDQLQDTLRRTFKNLTSLPKVFDFTIGGTNKGIDYKVDSSTAIVENVFTQSNLSGEVVAYNLGKLGTASASSVFDSFAIRFQSSNWNGTSEVVHDWVLKAAGDSAANSKFKISTDTVGDILVLGRNKDVKIFGSWTVQGLSSPPPVSSSGQGRIYFDTASGKFKVSENGNAYVDLVGGGGGGGGTPGGDVGAVQFNAGAGNFGGSSGVSYGLMWDSTNKVLKVHRIELGPVGLDNGYIKEQTDIVFYPLNTNIFIGRGAGHETMATGQNNIAIGSQALRIGAVINNNIAIGSQALYGVSGNNNVAIGTDSYKSLLSGSDYNVGIGYKAGEGFAGLSSKGNVCIGAYAGTDPALATGNFKFFLGSYDPATATKFLLLYGEFNNKLLQVRGTLELFPKGTNVGDAGEIRFRELEMNGFNYVGFRAPDNINNSVIWTLPNADGTSGQVLTTNGAGRLLWTTSGGISGSGSVKQVAVWNGINSIAGYYGLVFDNTIGSGALGVGTNAPRATLEVNGYPGASVLIGNAFDYVILRSGTYSRLDILNMTQFRVLDQYEVPIFVFDASNKKIGINIGTGVPTAALDINVDSGQEFNQLRLRQIASTVPSTQGQIGHIALYDDGAGTKRLYVKFSDGWHYVDLT